MIARHASGVAPMEAVIEVSRRRCGDIDLVAAMSPVDVTRRCQLIESADRVMW